MLKEQIRVEIARIINASCIDPPTREEPDRPINCHADCGLCKADQILDLLPLWVMQSRPNPSPFPIRRRGHWVFKTDKLTPLQVKACVCQQCPFPGELETKCDWCDNPKMMEFFRLAIPAIDDFYNQSKQAALKAQMERVIGVIEEKMEKLTSTINSYQCPQQVPTAYLAQLYALKALKAELEGENG